MQSTRILLGIALVTLLALPAMAEGERHPDDVHWFGGFGPSGQVGLDGQVHCSVIFEGTMVVGGNFTTAGGNTVNHIAAWDGYGWASLGDGFDDLVLALAIHDGLLYAGGEFINAEGSVVNYLAVWDGESWSDVDQGVNGPIYALISHDGYLWLGGSFDATIADSYAACKVMRWDGVDYVGAGGTTNCLFGEVLCFAVYQTSGADPILAAGGNFSTLGGNQCDGVAYWSGDNWLSISGGVDGTVYDMVEFEDKLLVAGDFGLVDGWPISYLALWDGITWEPLDSSEPDDVVRTIYLDGPELIVGGDFLNVGTTPTKRVIHFFDGTWTALTDQCEASVRMLNVHLGALHVGGDFNTGDGSAVDYIGLLQDNSWVPLNPDGLGTNGTVYTVCDYNGELVIGGSFSTVGGGLHRYLAAWDGSGVWHDLGGIVDGQVYALCNWDGNLVVGGDFTDVNGVAVSNIALWNGSTWSALGAGCSAFVWDLIEHDGDLIAAGHFMSAGGVSVYRIARWDGVAWNAIGDGFSDTCYGLLSHMGVLYATGIFDYTSTGTPVHKVCYYNAADWVPLGDGLTSDGYTTGYDLATFEGEIYIAGRFTEIDGLPTTGFAKWDGANWVTFGAGAYGAGYDAYCTSLTLYRDRLVVGGNFDSIQGTDSGSVIFWNGESFQSLGSAFPTGSSSFVNKLHSGLGWLFAGGNFMEVGGKPSQNIAMWIDDWTPVLLTSFQCEHLATGVRLDWEISVGSPDFDLRLLRSGPEGESEIAIREQAPYVYSAHDDSAELLLGGEFTYRLFGREGDEDWLLLRSENISIAASTRPASFVGIFPNPFNPKTTLRMIMPQDGMAKLRVFDVAGRLVRVLHDGELLHGVRDFTWRGDDQSGAPMASGVYHALLETEGHSETRRLVLVR